MNFTLLSLSVLSLNLIDVLQADSVTDLNIAEPIFVTEFRAELQLSLEQLHSSITHDIKGYKLQAPVITPLTKPENEHERDKARLLIVKN